MTAPTLTIFDELPLTIPAITQPGQIQAMVREKLAALTRLLQLLIRSKPQEMARLLALYQNFLPAKEALEHYFGREHAWCLPGRGEASGLVPGKTRATGKPEGRQVELAGVIALFGRLQLLEKDLKGCSPALDASFEELKQVGSLLEVYRRETAPASLPVLLPPAGNLVRRQVLLLPVTSRAHTRSRATA